MSIQKRAEEFVKRWQALPGDEDGETQKFWIELLGDVFQVPQPTKLLKFERHVMRRRIDVLCQDRGVLIEHKSRGIDLDKPRDNGQYGYETPYQQAKWYVTYLTKDERPDYIITCNFDEIRIYNEHIEGNVCIKMRLEELPIHYQLLLNIFTSDKYSRVVKEKELSFEAGKIVGRLYNALSQRYLNIETSEDEQKSLNILIVRFVFLLYAEDSGVMQTDVFCRFLQNVPTANLRQEFAVLFRTLNTPEHERSLYLRDDLKAFPYVNGGLFAKVGIDPETDIVIPQFTPEIHRVLIEEASQGFNWALVNPTIFGAVFESTLNPETRRAGGMHYTSTENIHKVIDPLFLDELTAELERIEALKSASEQVIACKKFQKRLSSLRVLDPACGSGNFLTETYLSLRKLENRALALMLAGKQASFDFGDESSPIQVRITQFYGIEINDFAVEVARTAMWIAQSQMAAETSGIVEQALHVLPLTSIPGIVEGNALRMDWNEVLPASECTHIIGNPPFLGHQLRSKLQQEDMDIAYQKQGKYGKLDYVCAWYRKAIQYIGARPIRFAFVSTNSICQGESVRTMWEPIFNAGFEIDFAWPTFIWNSESVEVAHVHVVIIGLSGQKFAMKQKLLFKEGDIHNATHINGYLIEAPDVFIENRGKPCNPGAPEMTKGSQPTDGGHLVLSPEEAEHLIKKYPPLSVHIRPFIGAREFINGEARYCLWLKGVAPSQYFYPEIQERLRAVSEMRKKSPTASVQESTSTPALFTQIRQPETDYLLVPQVSSERRKYIPIGYVKPETIVSNAAYIIPDASLYDFGLLCSQFHNAWMRIVAGRLKSDYRYSPAVYNSFVFPNASAAQKAEIERLANEILKVRAAYEGVSLAQLYDPEKMPFDLLAAHEALDAAVEQAYGVDFGGDEEKIVSHLFTLYAQATS